MASIVFKALLWVAELCEIDTQLFSNEEQIKSFREVLYMYLCIWKFVVNSC